MSAAPLPLMTRWWFAVVCLFRVLFDGGFAGRVWAVRDGMPALPKPDPEAEPEPEPEAEPEPDPEAEPEPEPEAVIDLPSGALAMLELLQREGRLVDFLQQDIAAFSDADVGAAARVVHEGCGKALRDHATVAPVRSEEEQSTVVVREGVATGEVKLTGKVAGEPPYRGKLQHRGWRVTELSLPKPLPGRDASVVAPAEVEL
ncbi:MAG: DUF2760 domain-containing protein [Polyangiaceae bacterium]